MIQTASDEIFDPIDHQLEAIFKKTDRWFALQYTLMAILAVLILFTDEIRAAAGL